MRRSVWRTAPRLPLEQVTAWYDAHTSGTSQIATTAEEIALFELLALARAEEDDETSVLRLSRAVEALAGRPDSMATLFQLRDALAHGSTPVFHPMHDDALDGRVHDATEPWIDGADAAATTVIEALQQRIRAFAEG
jgi:hypothetical protein